MRAMKALARLHRWAGLFKPQLLANALSTKISCAGIIQFSLYSCVPAISLVDFFIYIFFLSKKMQGIGSSPITLDIR